MKIQVVPSILAADFGMLAHEAKRAEDAGADGLHIDIMDGHFVPNLSMGPKAVASLKRATSLFLDVHLMIYNPFDYVERFIEAGADRITFHFEATEDVLATIDYIRRCNAQAGLAFSPETSLSMMPKYLDKCDMLLLMTVKPGFGGQKFMESELEKIAFVRKIAPKLPIQVDGGIDDTTSIACLEAGANILVSGTYLFKAKDMASAINKLKRV